MEQDSPDLRLIPPARGISATYNVMVEYSLKVKSNGSDASEKDDELIDGCFEVKRTPCSDIQLRNVRLFSSLGPIDVRFAILRYAEATIDIEVRRAIARYNLSTVTASTCGYEDEIMLYDRSAPYPLAALNYGSSSLVAVASAVVAVELGCDVKLRIGIATGEELSFHDLFFTAQKHNTTEELIVIDSIFEVKGKPDAVVRAVSRVTRSRVQSSLSVDFAGKDLPRFFLFPDPTHVGASDTGSALRQYIRGRCKGHLVGHGETFSPVFS